MTEQLKKKKKLITLEIANLTFIRTRKVMLNVGNMPGIRKTISLMMK